jgi:hypothetical protein
MKTNLLVLLFLFSINAIARADDNFEKGPLDVKWGDSIQYVQSVYPDGLTWPTTNAPDAITYSILKDSKAYWLGIPIQEVKFSFKSNGKLHTVFFEFKHSDAEVVKQKTMKLFGDDFKARKDDTGLMFSWKNSTKYKAQLSVNSLSPHEWVILGVQEISQ